MDTVTMRPLTELERDLALLEDVINDVMVAWGNAVEIPLTPRAFDRIVNIDQRLLSVSDQIRDLNVAVRRLVHAGKRELGHST